MARPLRIECAGALYHVMYCDHDCRSRFKAQLIDNRACCRAISRHIRFNAVQVRRVQRP